MSFPRFKAKLKRLKTFPPNYKKSQDIFSSGLSSPAKTKARIMQSQTQVVGPNKKLLDAQASASAKLDKRLKTGGFLKVPGGKTGEVVNNYLGSGRNTIALGNGDVTIASAGKKVFNPAGPNYELYKNAVFNEEYRLFGRPDDIAVYVGAMFPTLSRGQPSTVYGVGSWGARDDKGAPAPSDSNLIQLIARLSDDRSVYAKGSKASKSQEDNEKDLHYELMGYYADLIHESDKSQKGQAGGKRGAPLAESVQEAASKSQVLEKNVSKAKIGKDGSLTGVTTQKNTSANPKSLFSVQIPGARLHSNNEAALALTLQNLGYGQGDINTLVNQWRAAKANVTTSAPVASAVAAPLVGNPLVVGQQ